MLCRAARESAIIRAAPVTGGGGDSSNHALDADGSQVRSAWCTYGLDLLDKEPKELMDQIHFKV